MQEKDTASAAGILGAHAGIIGCIQAMEALKYLAGIPSPLVGAMLSADTRRMRFTTILWRLIPRADAGLTGVRSRNEKLTATAASGIISGRYESFNTRQIRF